MLSVDFKAGSPSPVGLLCKMEYGLWVDVGRLHGVMSCMGKTLVLASTSGLQGSMSDPREQQAAAVQAEGAREAA